METFRSIKRGVSAVRKLQLVKSDAAHKKVAVIEFMIPASAVFAFQLGAV